jgi:hypothetical protein
MQRGAEIVAPEVAQERIDLIEIYRVGPGGQLLVRGG